MTENKWFNMLAGNSEQAPKSEKPEDTIPEYLRRPEVANPDYDPNVDYQQFKKQMGRIHNQLQSVMPEAVYGTAAQEVMRTTPNEAYSNPFDWSLEKAIEQTSARAEQQEVQKKAVDKANEYLPEEDSFGERLKRWTEGFSSPTIGVAGISITPPKETHSYREALAGTTWDIVSSLPTDEGGKVLVNGLAYDKNKLSVSLMPYVEAAIEPVLMRDKGYWDVFAQKRGFGSYTSMLDFYDAKVDELESAIKPLDLTSSVSATNPNPNVQSGAMFAQAMSREASGAKAVRDARDKLNAMRDGTFWNGVFEGGDAFNALTLGLSGLYSEIELNKTLNKVYDGEALTEREQAIFDIYSTTKELESLDNYLGKSWIRDVGNAIGVTAEMAPQFIPAMGVAGSLANLSKVGIKAGYGLVRRAMRQGITNGVIEIGKQTARVGYNVGKNLFMANVGGAVGAIMQPATYSNFIQKRNEQFSMQNGRLVYTPTEEWKDFVNALIEQTNEVSSEVLGGAVSDILGLSFKGFGKMLGIDKAVNSVSSSMGLGASYGKLFGIKKSDAFKAFERSLSYAGDPFSEALSEIWGDVSSNFMKMLVSGDADWSQFNDPRYWTTNLAVAAIYGGAMQMAHEASRIPDYMTIAKLGKVKHETVRTIESKVLADALRMMGVDKDINASAQRLASIDWGSQNPMDRAKTADYIRAEAIQQVMLGVSEENTHLTQFARDAQEISASVYTGKDGNAVSDKVIEAELEDGTMVNVVSGDMTDMDAIIMVRNSEGVVEPIARQKIKIVAMSDVASKVEQRFKDLFGQQQISQKIAEIEQKYDELVDPTKEDVAQMMEELSIAEPQEGETITLVDGRKALFLGWNEDMTLNVEAQSADGTYELLVVPFHKILSSASHIAEAQIASLAEKTLDVAKEELVNEEVETTTAETIEEGVIVDTPQGKARVVQVGEDSIIVDHNLNSNGRAEDMETAEYALDEVGLPTSLETEPVVVEQQDSEQAQVEAAKNVEVAQNAVAGIKAVPMNEDGTINYDAIDDPIVFAQQYKNEVGNVEQAIADVTEARNAAEVKVQEVADKSKKLTSMNERNASRKEVEALKQRVAFYDAVLKELTPKEEKTVGLVENEFTRDINEDVLATIEEFAQRFGVLVELVEAATDGNGNVVNGYIKDGKVYLTADGKLRTRSLSFLVGHEFTHRMKDLSPEQFEAYKQSVRAFVGEEKWAKLILNMQSRYVFNNMPKQAENTALMEEEVASDFMGTMVESNDAFNSYLYSLNTETGLLAAIKRVLRAIGELFTDKEEKRVNDMLNQVNALIAAAEKANVEGVEPNDGKAKMSIIGEQGEAKYSVSSAPIFYSNAQFAVQNIKQEKATPEQWLKMIEKNGGLKAGEDKWLGLSDWLKASDKKALTKDEVLQYIAENDIQIKEVEYAQFGPGLIDEATRKLEAEMREIGIDAMREKYNGFDDLFEVYNNELVWSENMASESEYEDFIIDNNIVDVNAQANAINDTRSGYTTNGLTNKREIALVVPTIEPYNAHDEVHFGDAGGGRAVAWIRFGETTDADGKRVLVIDEIQSKRHQDGREKGYSNRSVSQQELYEAQEAAFSKVIDYESALADKYGEDEWAALATAEEMAEYERLRALDEAATNAYENYDKGVPSAPFEKNWAELAFKRMLRYAAENGYDYVAWTTGDQQAKRYGMLKAVSKIVRRDNSLVEGKRFLLVGDTVVPHKITVSDEGVIVASTIENIEGKPLSEVMGKEVALKMMQMENEASLESANLRIGGEGMKGFYDQMLPSFVKKYTKKWGAEVGEVTMPDLEENNTMHAVNVTDSMRESVMQGQPKFSLQVSAEELAEIEAERQSIIETAKANGTYLKAPNGNDTHLTPEQWADVRTSRFKKWFGDWEFAALWERVQNLKTIFIPSADLTINDAEEIYNNIGVVENVTDGRKVYFVHGTFGKIVRHKGYDTKQLIPLIAEVFQTSTPIGFEKEIKKEGHKDHSSNFVGYHHYLGKINSEGEEYYVRFTVQQIKTNPSKKKKEGFTPNQLHSTFVSDIEIYSTDNRVVSGNSPATANDDAINLDTKLETFLNNAKSSYENSSKIVDENGEPKVVWHGGQFSISNFIPKRNMHFGTKRAAMQRVLDEQWGYDNWLIQNEDGSYSWKYEDEYDEAYNVQSNKTFATEEETMEDALLYFGNEVVVKPYFLNIRHLERTDDAQSSWDDAIDVVKAESDNVDGIVYENWYEDKGSDSYVAFNPNQIKSATDNVGTYNANTPDVRYSLITPEMDASYLDAVERGDMETAQKMVMEAAEKAGYINDESWRMNHRAPRKDEENANPFNTEKIVPEDFWEHPEWYTNIRHSSETRESYYAMKPAIDKYKRLMAEGKTEEAENVTITMYRGVDKTANKREALFRNGDWITPSRSYALLSAPYRKARVISQEVKLKDIWWDGNSIDEWGYDDGANYGYRDTKNNRKLLDPVTYDDAGNVIPLSERFNPRKEDIRYSLIGEIGAANLESYGRYGSPMLALEMARELEAQGKSVKDIRLATNWERGVDGKWRYEIMDGEYNHPKDDDITKKRYPLADILDNADLYKAYPYLKDMEVEYDPNMKARGEYWGDFIKLNSTRTPKQIGSTLMHEVQHAIQVVELFARGSSSERFKDQAYVEQLEQEMESLGDEFVNTPNTNVLRLAYLLYQGFKKNNEINAINNKAYKAYRRAAGEVEARNVQSRLSMTPEERLRTPLSATEDVARKHQRIYEYEMDGATAQQMLANVNSKQKVVNARIEHDNAPYDERFSLRDDIDARIAKKRPDITTEERIASVNYIMGQGDAKTSKVFAHYFVCGTIRLGEDDEKVKQAIETAKRAKVDPMSFKSPDELLDVHAQFKPKAKPIDPDKVPTLSDKRDYGNGIVTYLVDDSQESRENMREIINTHYGKEANPWCLLAGNGNGRLIPESAKMWYETYNAYPKRVAFYKGKLLAFSANGRENILWWDRLDHPYSGIPVVQKIGDGRKGTQVFNETTTTFEDGYHYISKGNRINGVYEEWHDLETLAFRANYKDGKFNGVVEEWGKDGHQIYRKEYDNGALDGVCEDYYDNGQVRERAYFRQDDYYKKEAYHKDGTLSDIESIDGDVQTSEGWYKDGSLKYKKKYDLKTDFGGSERYYSNGQISERNTLQKDDNGDVVRTKEAWYENGVQELLIFANNATGDGESIYWYANGQIKYEEYQKNYKLDGRVAAYNEDGSLRYTTPYKEGNKDGEEVVYYPNGKVKTYEEYTDGKRDGVYIEYNEDGSIADARTYKDGAELNEPLFSVRDMPFFEDNGDVIIFDDLAEEDARERKPLVTEDTLRSYIDGRHYAATQRIRKEADDMKQIARLRLQEECRKRSDGIISQRSNVGKVSYILGDIPRGSLSFYDQALVMIAEGEVSIMWGTDKNGRKGLAAELGLKDGEKKDYRQITKGATQSFEGFVHNWWESFGGYEMGIDTQDLRNALIEALSETGKAHVAINILRQKYDAPQQEYDNAIADIEAHVDRELQMEDTRYKEEIAEFEGGANKQQLTRYYEQNAIFNDDISAIRYTIRELEKKLERATREVASARQRNKEYAKKRLDAQFERNKEYTKKRLDAQFERNKEYTKKVVTELRENIEAAKATIKGAISNSPALKFYGREVQAVVASLGDVRSSKSLEAVLGRVENMLLNIRIREERNNMQRLLNMRLPNGQLVEEWVGNQIREARMTAAEGHIIISDMFRGVNSKGVKVAKKVDNHVQEVMTFLRNELVLPIAKKRVRITLESGKERREFDPEKELTEPTKALRAANDMAIKTIEEKAAEGGRDYSSSEKVELEARDLFNLYLDVVEYKYALHENKERIETYKERIRNLKAGVEDLKTQNKPVDDIIVANIEAARNILSKIYANNVEHKRNYEKSIQTFNKVVGDLLAKGRDALKAFRIGKEEHKAKIITLALKAIGGKDAKSNPQAPTSMEKVAAFMREWINDPYWTFETCCREIDRFAPNGEGEFFKYFMGGAQDAANKLILSHVAHMERVGDKIQKLWRKHRNKTPYEAYEAVMTEADTHVVGSITYMTKWDAENKVAHNPETTELRISNAMYVIAMWRQAQYQETMARYGITQEKIDAIIESIRRIDPRYIDFMDFVNDTFLPATRLEYDEVHKKMFGTSMAEIKNYFPAEVIRKYEEVDVSKTADGALPSTVTRSIISRRPHGNLPKFTLNYFGMLLSHIQDMDHWASYGQLIEDINTVLSNVEFKKRLNEYMSGTNNDRTGAGSLYHIFRTRCAIMTGAYQSKRMKQDWVKLLTRGFASSNISWRLSTALKQLSSSPMFAAYSVNPKCLAIWAKNFVLGAATIRKTIAWAVENSPSFRERWAMKYSGNEKLMQTSRDIRTGIDPTIASRSAIVKAGKNTLDIVEKIAVEWGMAPNAAIDAWVCATGMKTIYEFEISKATGGKREATEQEKNATMRKAEIFMNTTQQSAESAYISEIQAQGSWLTMYMNASYAFHRLRIRGAQELWKGLTNKGYRRNVIDKYGKEALSDANKKAAARLIQGIIGDLNFWMISAAGKSLWGLINEVIYGADDDEDEDEPMTAMEKIWSVARVPLSMAFNGYVGGNLLGSAMMGFEVDYNAPMNSLFEDIKKVFDFKKDDEDNVTDLTYNIWGGFSLVAKYGLGVDLNTYLNIVRGIGEINSVEGIMKIFNEPRSAIKLIAGRRRKGETMKEYVDRLIHLELVIDNVTYEDLVDEEGNYIGEGKISRMHYLSAKLVRGFMKEYRERQLRKVLSREEFENANNIDERYNIVCERMGWDPEKAPTNDKVDKSGDYTLEQNRKNLWIFPEGLTEKEYYKLKEIAAEAAAKCRERNKFIGSDESLKSLLEEEYNLKQNVIDVYNEL